MNLKWMCRILDRDIPDRRFLSGKGRDIPDRRFLDDKDGGEKYMAGMQESKISLLMDYTDRPGSVADPWYTRDFETTYRDVVEGCEGLLKYLKRRGKC